MNESQQQIAREAAEKITDQLQVTYTCLADYRLKRDAFIEKCPYPIILSAIERATEQIRADRDELSMRIGFAQPQRSEPDTDDKHHFEADGGPCLACGLTASQLIVAQQPTATDDSNLPDSHGFEAGSHGISVRLGSDCPASAPRGEQEWSKAGTHCIKIGDRNVHFYEVRDRDLCIDNHNASLKANNLRGGVESRHAESPGLETHASGSGALDRPSRGRTGNDLGSGSSAPPSQKKAAPRREQAEQQDWRHMEKAHKEVLLERQVSQKLATERQRQDTIVIEQGSRIEALECVNRQLRDKLLSAHAAIEKCLKDNAHLADGEVCALIALKSVDLSALHQHDAEVRKPLVEALERISVGAIHMPWRDVKAICDGALAEVKEGK